jgi:hypothetical protein
MQMRLDPTHFAKMISEKASGEKFHMERSGDDR